MFTAGASKKRKLDTQGRTETNSGQTVAKAKASVATHKDTPKKAGTFAEVKAKRSEAKEKAPKNPSGVNRKNDKSGSDVSTAGASKKRKLDTQSRTETNSGQAVAKAKTGVATHKNTPKKADTDTNVASDAGARSTRSAARAAKKTTGDASKTATTEATASTSKSGKATKDTKSGRSSTEARSEDSPSLTVNGRRIGRPPNHLADKGVTKAKKSKGESPAFTVNGKRIGRPPGYSMDKEVAKSKSGDKHSLTVDGKRSERKSGDSPSLTVNGKRIGRPPSLLVYHGAARKKVEEFAKKKKKAAEPEPVEMEQMVTRSGKGSSTRKTVENENKNKNNRVPDSEEWSSEEESSDEKDKDRDTEEDEVLLVHPSKQKKYTYIPKSEPTLTANGKRKGRPLKQPIHTRVPAPIVTGKRVGRGRPLKKFKKTPVHSMHSKRRGTTPRLTKSKSTKS